MCVLDPPGGSWVENERFYLLTGLEDLADQLMMLIVLIFFRDLHDASYVVRCVRVAISASLTGTKPYC